MSDGLREALEEAYKECISREEDDDLDEDQSEHIDIFERRVREWLVGRDGGHEREVASLRKRAGEADAYRLREISEGKSDEAE
jgi:hypothetical protein